MDTIVKTQQTKIPHTRITPRQLFSIEGSTGTNITRYNARDKGRTVYKWCTALTFFQGCHVPRLVPAAYGRGISVVCSRFILQMSTHLPSWSKGVPREHTIQGRHFLPDPCNHRCNVPFTSVHSSVVCGYYATSHKMPGRQGKLSLRPGQRLVRGSWLWGILGCAWLGWGYYIVGPTMDSPLTHCVL